MELTPAHYEALDRAHGLAVSPRSLELVARVVGPELSRWAFKQWELRARATAKFTDADKMLFTQEALEQASHEAVAAYHASFFPAGELVVDCTTGIGADLIALARRGPVLGFDLDPERVAYARHNLAALGLEGEVVCADSMSSDWRGSRYAFADPARRVEGRRTLRMDEFTPPLPSIVSRFAELDCGLIKLSSACRLEDLEALGGLEMVSFGRQCREALVIQGSSGRTAFHIESGSRWCVGDSGYPLPSPLPRGEGAILGVHNSSPREGEVPRNEAEGVSNFEGITPPPSSHSSRLPQRHLLPKEEDLHIQSPSLGEGVARYEPGEGIAGLPALSSVQHPHPNPLPLGSDRYLAELDPALARYQDASLPESVGATRLGQTSDIFEATQPTESPWLRWFRVVAELPYDTKHVKKWLQESGAALDAVKPRGIDVEPRDVEKKLNPAKLPRRWVLFIIGGKPKTRAIITERLP